MTIKFTDEEINWIIKEPFNWHIKKGCPQKIKENLTRKLNNLYKENNKWQSTVQKS